jgi:Kef-type K+ transport system membrane component KefB
VDHGIDLATLLLAFASALIGAKLFGELAERLGQPSVLGELLAGILLGPSVLGLVPITAGVYLLAEIGVILLLFEVGRVGAPALVVALAGMALPFLGGLLFGKATGALPEGIFVAVVIAVFATTFLAPPLLKAFSGGVGRAARPVSA